MSTRVVEGYRRSSKYLGHSASAGKFGDVFDHQWTTLHYWYLLLPALGLLLVAWRFRRPLAVPLLLVLPVLCLPVAAGQVLDSYTSSLEFVVPLRRARPAVARARLAAGRRPSPVRSRLGAGAPGRARDGVVQQQRRRQLRRRLPAGDLRDDGVPRLGARGSGGRATRRLAGSRRAGAPARPRLAGLPRRAGVDTGRDGRRAALSRGCRRAWTRSCGWRRSAATWTASAPLPHRLLPRLPGRLSALPLPGRTRRAPGSPRSRRTRPTPTSRRSCATGSGTACPTSPS